MSRTFNTIKTLAVPVRMKLGAALAGVIMLGAIPAWTQVTIGETLAGGVSVRGRVADVFGDRFLLEDSSGRVLVETGSASSKPDSIETGQNLTVDGRLRGRVIEALKITATGAPMAPTNDVPAPLASDRSSPPQLPAPQTGDLLASLAKPADQTSLRRTMEGIGFTIDGAPVRHDKDTEIPVRDAQGRAWVAWLDRFGRATEIEIVDYDDDKVPASPSFRPADLPTMVAKEGFQARGSAERRPEHFELLASNQRGELLELHIDFAGQIYKQVWVR